MLSSPGVVILMISNRYSWFDVTQDAFSPQFLLFWGHEYQKNVWNLIAHYPFRAVSFIFRRFDRFPSEISSKNQIHAADTYSSFYKYSTVLHNDLDFFYNRKSLKNVQKIVYDFWTFLKIFPPQIFVKNCNFHYYFSSVGWVTRMADRKIPRRALAGEKTVRLFRTSNHKNGLSYRMYPCPAPRTPYQLGVSNPSS